MEQESHFLGSGAFANLGLSATQTTSVSTASGSLSFRQVSLDPKNPVFFVKNPALLYGRTPNTGQGMFEEARGLCDGLAKDIPSTAISKCVYSRSNRFEITADSRIQRLTLPAVPIINFKRLETSCLGIEGSGPVPYALLTGIMAHSTHYVPPIKHLHFQLWRQALLALDDEYRLPRLSTLQLALLQVYSRPMERSENAGQISIAISRVSQSSCPLQPVLSTRCLCIGDGSGTLIRLTYGPFQLDATTMGDQPTKEDLVGFGHPGQMASFALWQTEQVSRCRNTD